jgi:outer membrane protein OmpA-like peptidoglycan-associated protein
VALEKLRDDPTLSQADRQAFDLLAAADDLLVRAQAEWQSGQDPLARRDALMGQIKMKTALAMLQAQRAKARSAELDEELALARDEDERVEEELAVAREEVALLARFRDAKSAAAEERKTFAAQIDDAKKQAASERKRLSDQLLSQARRADALDGLRKAELAIRNAETVDARRYAKAKYAAAAAMLQEAHKHFDAGSWPEVIERTALAAAEADASASLARPLYEAAAATMTNRARDRALEADVTALPGVPTRLERDGDVQRLVLMLGGLFDEGKTILAPKGAKILDAVHDLLAKYPTYSVQVTGYADGQGKPADQITTSLARANAVYWSFVTRGIDPKRMTVDGRGAAAPVGAGPTSDGHARDVCVELTLLYHIDHEP